MSTTETVDPKPGGSADASGPKEDLVLSIPVAMRLYIRMLDKLLPEGSPLQSHWVEEAQAMYRQFNPRDPIEEMMTGHLLWMHAHIAYFGYFGLIQKKMNCMQGMHQMMEKTIFAYRRHVDALMQYRQPGRKQFVAVRQANFAQQQVVANVKLNRRNKKRVIKKNGEKNENRSRQQIAV